MCTARRREDNFQKISVLETAKMQPITVRNRTQGREAIFVTPRNVHGAEARAQFSENLRVERQRKCSKSQRGTAPESSRKRPKNHPGTEPELAWNRPGNGQAPGQPWDGRTGTGIVPTNGFAIRLAQTKTAGTARQAWKGLPCNF